MTKNEIQSVVREVRENCTISMHVNEITAYDIFDGCASPDFKKGRYASREVVKWFLRYQCQYLGSGEFDEEELSKCCQILSEKFILV